MWHTDCPKLSNYKHTHTHTELYYADTCVLASTHLQLASSKNEQTFIKTLLCYVLYVFDFSALTSPFSQDIPTHIICIYNVSSLVSIEHPRLALTETPMPIRRERLAEESAFANRALANVEDCLASSTSQDRFILDPDNQFF